MKNLTIIGIVNVMGWILAELGSLQHPDPAFALYWAEWICEVICKFGRHYFIQVIFNEIDVLSYVYSHIWPFPVAIFLAFWVWEAFGAS